MCTTYNIKLSKKRAHSKVERPTKKTVSVRLLNYSRGERAGFFCATLETLLSSPHKLITYTCGAQKRGKSCFSAEGKDEEEVIGKQFLRGKERRKKEEGTLDVYQPGGTARGKNKN